MHALHAAQVADLQLERFGQLKHSFVPLLLLGTPVLALFYRYLTAEVFTVGVVVLVRLQFELPTRRAFLEFVVRRTLPCLLLLSLGSLNGLRLVFGNCVTR